MLLETKTLEDLLQKVYDGIKINLELIRNKIKQLVTKMENKVKPLIASMGTVKKTLSVVKIQDGIATPMDETRHKIDKI